VVELINTIAGQTNLLALNATIEPRPPASRQGLAVVASEVKALAEQTAKATGEIGQQITGIQAATQDSVNAIKEISSPSRSSPKSRRRSRRLWKSRARDAGNLPQRAAGAQGTQQVSSNITDVQRAPARRIGVLAVLSAAQSLRATGNRLKLEVGKFLDSVGLPDRRGSPAVARRHGQSRSRRSAGRGLAPPPDRPAVPADRCRSPRRSLASRDINGSECGHCARAVG